MQLRPVHLQAPPFSGLIGSLFSLLQFLMSPLTGALSDRHGRRPMLLLTTVGSIPYCHFFMTLRNKPHYSAHIHAIGGKSNSGTISSVLIKVIHLAQFVLH